MPKMGFHFSDRLCKRKNRWVFTFSSVIGDPQGNQSNISILPLNKAKRASFNFKTMEARHLVEDIYYPARPEWRTINLTAYDIKTSKPNPILEKIKEVYDPKVGTWKTSTDGFITDAFVKLIDSCGELIEQWVFENAWIEAADFGELDYGSSEIITCDITLRYARSYIETNV